MYHEQFFLKKTFTAFISLILIEAIEAKQVWANIKLICIFKDGVYGLFKKFYCQLLKKKRKGKGEKKLIKKI